MTQYSDDLVSVLLPTHNRADLLPRAVNSVLAQTYKNIEILIVDDGSTDNTEQVVRSLMEQEPRIRYFRQPAAKGACAARNVALREARGKFITALDDDDEFLPTRIETLLAHFDEKWSFVCAGIIVRHPDHDLLTKQQRQVLTFDDCLYANLVGNQTLTLTSRLLALEGYDESLRAYQDYDMWIRLLQRFGHGLCIGNPSYIQYVAHGGKQITGTASNKLKGHLQFNKKHGKLMKTAHHKMQRFELVRLKDVPLNLSDLFKLWVPKYTVLQLRYYLKKRYPWLLKVKRNEA